MIVSITELANALNCTERNIRKREGSTLPKFHSYTPRTYDLAAVLWVVDGQEREYVCEYFGLDAKHIQKRMAEGLEENNETERPSASFGFEEDNADPLLQ